MRISLRSWGHQRPLVPVSPLNAGATTALGCLAGPVTTLDLELNEASRLDSRQSTAPASTTTATSAATSR